MEQSYLLYISGLISWTICL